MKKNVLMIVASALIAAASQAGLGLMAVVTCRAQLIDRTKAPNPI